LLAACSTVPQYQIQPDYDYIQQVENSSKVSSHTATVYWVNPPIKRQQQQENKQD
jgi:hypothetical protein